VNLPYVVFDAAVFVLAIRSLIVLGGRARWTGIAWGATAVCAGSAALRYAQPGPSPYMLISEIFFAVLTAAFIVAAVRDEPQAEPLLWPTRIGLTRAQKR
jgi:hypothetical protein